VAKAKRMGLARSPKGGPPGPTRAGYERARKEEAKREEGARIGPATNDGKNVFLLNDHHFSDPHGAFEVLGKGGGGREVHASDHLNIKRRCEHGL